MFQSRRPARPFAPRAGRLLAVMALCASHVVCVHAWVKSEASPAQVYSTVVGQRKQVTLGVGGVANLNTSSVLRVSETSERCEADLERGEALFEVPDADHPVHVRAGPITLQTKGSVFALRVRDAKHVDVLVREGTVHVSSAHDEVEVSAQQVARVSPAGIELKLFTDTALARQLEWMTGHISFNGVTLAEAVAEFNRYNERKLVIADKSIRELAIGGKFICTDVDSFLAALAHIGVASQDGGTSASGARVVRLVGTGNSPP
jgi:transmembrane sensor